MYISHYLIKSSDLLNIFKTRFISLSIAFQILACFTVLSLMADEPATDTPNDAPLKILFITGGGFHDFVSQESILTDGLLERFGEGSVEFTVDHTAGRDPTSVPDRLTDPGFVEGYDLVLYNMSLSREQKPETAQNIIDSHVKHGVPAALLHGSTLS